jgi:hypothetical protein
MLSATGLSDDESGVVIRAFWPVPTGAAGVSPASLRCAMGSMITAPGLSAATGGTVGMMADMIGEEKMD